MAAERGFMEEMVKKMEAMNTRQEELVEKLRVYEGTQAQDKAELINKLNLYVQKQQGDTAEVKSSVTKAAEEMNRRYTEVVNAVKNIEGRMQGVERNQGSLQQQERRTLLNPKNMLPKELAKEDDWRRWKSDVEDYAEETFDGMKDFLEQVRCEDNPIDEQWFEQKGFAKHWWKKGEMLHRFLKRYTGTEARRVVMGAMENNGWEAWRRLSQQYEPATVTREAQVFARYTSMVNKRARNPRETKGLMVELGERARRVEEITGRPVEERHAMSVIAGILDPETQKYTAQYQGLKSSVDQLKRKVMEFVNLVTQSTDPMDLGRVQQHQDMSRCQGEECYEGEQEEEDGYLDALNTQCHKCGGYGHYSRECATKESVKGRERGHKGDRKGKGAQKGKGKDKGKGKGNIGKKGPQEGCWTCGGAHYQSDCPQAAHPKGSSKGGKGEVRQLSLLVNRPQGEVIKVSNRFQELAKEEDYEETVDRNPIQVTTISRDKLDYIEGGGEEAQREVQGPFGENLAENHRDSSTPHKKIDRKVWIDGQVNTKKELNMEAKVAASCRGRCGSEQPRTYADCVKGRVRALNLFREVAQHSVNNFEEQEWQEIELAVDSGATETVVGDGMLTNIETTEGSAFKRGVQYEVASGDLIPNLGEKRFEAVNEAGVIRGMTAQVCEVNKALLSVKRAVQAGNRVVFEPEGSYIEDLSTGEKLHLIEQGGMYVLKMWARRPFQRRAQESGEP